MQPLAHAAIYARVSSDLQEEAGTIQSQLDAILHSPALQGRQIIETYTDDGVSGYKYALWQRPAGARLLAAAEAGKLRGCDLFVYNLKRLGRKARDIEEAIDRLIQHGVTVVSIMDGYRFDNQTAMGKFTRQLLASLAELDRNTIIETTRAGMVRLARAGELLPSMLPLGYDWSEKTPDGAKRPGARMIIVPEEAELARWIFDHFPEMSTSAMVRSLNEQGCRLPCKIPLYRMRHQRTERLFTASAITRIVGNELYTGMVSWDRRGEAFRRHYPELQIISFESFNRANAAAASRRVVPVKSQGSPYVFSGLLRCPKCGGRTVGRRNLSHRSYPDGVKQYHCHAYHVHGSTACAGWTVNESVARTAIIAFLADLLENRLQLGQEHFRQAAQDLREKEGGNRIQTLQAEIASAEKDLKKAQDGYLAEIFTAEEARALTLQARERLERAERERRDAAQSQGMREELRAVIAFAERPICQVLEDLSDISLTRLCRDVFNWLSIRGEGFGWERQACVDGYELTPTIQAAIASVAGGSPLALPPLRWK